jgi:MYXO-CTERM domain-containing protein
MHALTLLAAENGWHHHGHWWIVFPILWVLLVALVAALLWRRRDSGDSPKRILGERFARGEISADEYRDRLAQLR